jgi:hypothetical protein
MDNQINITVIHLPKYLNPQTNTFEPDFSTINLEKWQVKSYVLNKDGESYSVELEWISDVPFSIAPAQGRMMLLKLGLLAAVKEAVKNSTDNALVIFWEYALSWDRDNAYIGTMAAMLEMSEYQTDDFFIEAKKI